jgi:hypothetical protein
MNITGCVPLAGAGIIARRGNLIALTDGMDPGPDPLLAALAAVADAGGDGAALALAVTRAALEHGGRPAWACAGVTFSGEVAVGVHGEAVAYVSVGDGPEAEVTASGSLIPVVRTFAGAAVAVRLGIGAPAAPDPRLWLDGGVVYGGGTLVTVTQGQAAQGPPPAAASPAAAEPAPLTAQGVTPPAGPAPEASPAPVPVPADAVPADLGYEPTMLAGAVARDVPPPAPPSVVTGTGTPAAFAAPEPAAGLGYEPTMLAGTPGPAGQAALPGQPAFPDDPFVGPAATAWPAEHDRGPERAAAGPVTESWFRAEAPQASGPTSRMTQSDGGVTDAFDPLIEDLSAMELVRLDAVAPVMVDGCLCARMHFNAPDATACRECGSALPPGGATPRGMPGGQANMPDIPAVARDIVRQPRPPLGVLLVDDGRGYALDRDYVIGREPVLDGDVVAGRATPLRITDPKGTVSRLHLRVRLVGWQVEVRDLGSANGSVLFRKGGPRTLTPHDAAVLDPGARVGVGRRTVQFVPYSPASFAAAGAATR